VRDLPRRLSSPRLAIVSPQALQPRSGEGARFLEDASGTGTGPFEVAAHGEDRLDLARSAGWWGTAIGLGPALDTVVFERAAGEEDRLRTLEEGEVEIAVSLLPSSLRVVASQPLLRVVASEPLLPVVRRGVRGAGVEASVRGFRGGPQSLSSVWLTTIAE
jgi:ABC-type transport system substrate-binding protein